MDFPLHGKLKGFLFASQQVFFFLEAITVYEDVIINYVSRHSRHQLLLVVLKW